MKLYNIEKQQNIIYYFIENFITLSNIRHKFLLTSNRFDIINTIDRKKLVLNNIMLPLNTFQLQVLMKFTQN